MSESKFEERVRLSIHEVLVHLRETWDAFSEAAAQMNLTPEQAQASLLAKVIGEIHDDQQTEMPKKKKQKDQDVSMHVTVLFRDVLQDAIAAVNKRFPGYTITSFEEVGHEKMMEHFAKKFVWHGNYENWPLRWEFVVEKQDPDTPGPSRAEISIHPIFDIIFKGYEDVFFVEIGFRDKPATIKVAGTDSPAIDAHVFFNPDGDL